MGVGKYNLPGNTSMFPVGEAPGGYVPPNPFAGGTITPPEGLSSNPFDQSAINWNMALKYGQERVQQNQDIWSQYQEALNQWNNNPLTRSATAPNMPAMFETDPYKLYNYFNSGQQGILTTNGVIDYKLDGSPMTMDPLQTMFAAGQPTPVKPQPGTQTLQQQFNLGPQPSMGPYPAGSLEAQFSGLGAGPFVGPLPLDANGAIPMDPAVAAAFRGNIPTDLPFVGPLQYPTTKPAGQPATAQSPQYQPVPGGQGVQASPAAATSQTPLQQLMQGSGNNWVGQLKELLGLAGGGAGSTGAGSAGSTGPFSLPDINWLRDFVQKGAGRTDVGPMWDAMLKAQEDNVARGADQISEYFNSMGGRFSSNFGTALGNYMEQTKKDQNALRAQLESAAAEAAVGRQLSGGSTLANLQTSQWALDQQIQAALEQQWRNFGFQSSMYNAQQADLASQILNANAVGASGKMFDASNLAAQLLYNTANTAGAGLFANQNQGLAQALQQSLAHSGLNMQSSQALMQFMNNLLSSGSLLSGQQISTGQDAINRQYQEWLRTNPLYNPLLQMILQASTAGTPWYIPGAQSSIFQQIMGLVNATAGVVTAAKGGG